MTYAQPVSVVTVQEDIDHGAHRELEVTVLPVLHEHGYVHLCITSLYDRTARRERRNIYFAPDKARRIAQALLDAAQLAERSDLIQ